MGCFKQGTISSALTIAAAVSYIKLYETLDKAVKLSASD